MTQRIANPQIYPIKSNTFVDHLVKTYQERIMNVDAQVLRVPLIAAPIGVKI